MNENDNIQNSNQPDGLSGDAPIERTAGEPAETAGQTPGNENVSAGNSRETDTGAQTQGTPYTPPSYPPYTGQQYTQQHPQQPYYYGNPQQPYYTQPQYTATAQYGTVTPPPQKGRKKGTKIFYSLLSVLLVFALVIGGFAIGKHTVATRGEDTTTTTADGATLKINDTPESSTQSTNASGALTTVQVANKVKASVVGILVYSTQSVWPSSSSGNGNSDSATGEGSGIIMGTDTSGKYTYIITCAHVISDTGVSISVQLSDGTKKEAEIVGYDLRTDVGVIKIKMTGLTAAEFGNSNSLQVGEQVFAVGNPGGTEFFGSFTSGVVSAIDRPISSEIGYTMECIQHDAAINPGNSGGALVNIYGQVIGINSLKIADTSYEGMGFAIPISSAKSIVDSLIKYGYVPNRPKLGITYYSADSNQSYSMIVQLKGLPSGSLIINEISADSSLANTKAKAGDLIIAANGKKLDTANVLLEIIDKGKVGDTITLTLCRVSIANNNYQFSNFDVKVKLVEDKGTTVSSTPTTEATTDVFSYFENPWG